MAYDSQPQDPCKVFIGSPMQSRQHTPRNPYAEEIDFLLDLDDALGVSTDQLPETW